jgi:hypothetical protein
MPAITKKDTRLKLQFVANTDHSIHAGLVAVEAMARRFDLWHKPRQLASLDPRKDQQRGFGPEVIVGQLIYALCSGGGSLSDREALNDDPLARELFGVGKFADHSQVGEWLREQSDESVAALRQRLHQFVTWVWQQAEPRRLLHGGGSSRVIETANGRLFIANLSKGQLGHDKASLLGSLLVTQFQLGAMARSTVAPAQCYGRRECC